MQRTWRVRLSAARFGAKGLESRGCHTVQGFWASAVKVQRTLLNTLRRPPAGRTVQGRLHVHYTWRAVRALIDSSKSRSASTKALSCCQSRPAPASVTASPPAPAPGTLTRCTTPHPLLYSAQKPSISTSPTAPPPPPLTRLQRCSPVGEPAPISTPVGFPCARAARASPPEPWPRSRFVRRRFCDSLEPSRCSRLTPAPRWAPLTRCISSRSRDDLVEPGGLRVRAL